MKKIVCDRCGNTIDAIDGICRLYNEVAITIGVKEDLPVVIKGANRIDLCDDCRTALNQWLKEVEDNDKVN